MNAFKCCLCGCEFQGYGNNPQGAAYKNEDGEVVFPEFNENDRCCDGCNGMYVIPGRLYKLAKIKEKQKK